ncbi:MAG: hypothetical protein HYW48_11245 [Deltaproteobacteria bacterium]|nr:hypothetical protein [Deltaproteobacteria bacterium]
MLRDNEQSRNKLIRNVLGLLILNVASLAFPYSREVPISRIVGSALTVETLLTMAVDSDESLVETAPPSSLEDYIEVARFQDISQLLNKPMTVATLVHKADDLKKDPILLAERASSPLSMLLESDEPARKREAPPQQVSDITISVVPERKAPQAQQAPNRAEIFTPEEPLTPLSEIQESVKPVVNVVLKNKEIIIFPSELSIPHTGDAIEVNISEEDGTRSELNIFVRNQDLVEWRDNEKQIIGRKEGATELYLHYKNSLYILPVTVGGEENNVVLPRELTVLDSVREIRSASYPQNLNLETLQQLASLGKKSHPNQEETEQIEEAPEHAPEKATFITTPSPYAKHVIDLQIVDERSDEENGALFPANGVQVRFLGTEIESESDAMGVVRGVELLQGSSFLVEIKDPLERFRPTVFELSDPIPDKVKITLLRNFAFDTYLQLAGSENRESDSSVCANVVSQDGKPQQDVKVEANVKGATPFYFNQYGYLDRLQDKTSKSGRFCMFNLEPGPLAFFFVNKDGEERGPVPLNLFEGYHSEYSFALGEKRYLETSLAAVPTAYEQWNGGAVGESHYRPLAYVDVYALGERGYPWEEDADRGVLYSSEETYNDRSFYLTRASEFEATLYRMDSRTGDNHVTPLFPRGFLDDIAFFAGLAVNRWEGSVLVEHGPLAGEEDFDGVKVTLLDHKGQKAGEKVAWEGSHSSHLFLNVPAGTYAVKVASPDGKAFWYDTVLVYEETLSYLHTGSPVLRSSQSPLLSSAR